MAGKIEHPNVLDTEVRDIFRNGDWLTQLVIYTDLDRQPDAKQLAEEILAMVSELIMVNETSSWNEVLLLRKERHPKGT